MGTLRQFSFSRSSTIRTLERIAVDKWDIQPDGFSNTIRWNAGHVFVVTEILLNKADHSYTMKNPDWSAFFAPGTRPSEWSEEAPSHQVLIDALTEQKAKTREEFFGKSNQPASESFSIGSHIMGTVDSLIQFATWHEGSHLGIIQSLDKITQFELSNKL
ncbi:DinB family protein [Lederbergia sp. NSJ-179]|uniref:DinB family protein n=1 Tax=Lederbergia sp. NSJ-179 TaxID=2931402 RepID=UPI001FD3C477|nr:DinB family protein [Lederbergia sp. NSJ-179]MCJ7842371.1 DinB family protein [Lederbergia sp. NSJ-179]